MTSISRGQRVLTEVNDAKALQLFLSNSQSSTQVYNQTTGGYTPDWTSSNPVITPELYIAGTNTNIIAQAKSITWFDGGSQISSGTNYTLGASNQTLTVNTNRVIPIDDGLSFDGATTGANPGTIFASAPTALTIQVKFRMVATPSNYSSIAEFGSPDATTGKSIYVEGVQGANQMLFGAAVTSGGTAFSGASNELRANVTINQWVVATMVLTSSNMIVYVNGTQVGQASGSYDLSRASANAFKMGNGRFFFNGDISYVGVFNTAVQPEFVSQYSTNGLSGSEPGIVNYWDFTKASGTTVADSVGSKTASLVGTFTLPSAATLHKRTLMCQVVYTDPAVNTDLNVTATIDISRLYAGATGDQGAPVAMATLSNDTAVITTANDGSGGTYGAPNTQSTLTIYLGGTDVTNLYTISQARNGVTVTEATTSNVATVTAMGGDTGSVVFTATRSGYPTLTKTFSLAKSKMGVVGQNPTDYWLSPSVSSIIAADDGSYNQTTVTFSAESQVGTNVAAAYSGRFIIAESTDGNSFTTKYTSAADESSKVYTPSAGIASIKATLYQAGGTSVKLDEQIIPIINNGKNSVYVNAWTPGGHVIHNAGNTVTAQADLNNGGLPATGSNYRWVKGNSGATSVIAGSGYEDLDLGKRNIVPGTSNGVGWNGEIITDPSTFSKTIAQTNESFIYSPYFNMNGGQTYTISFGSMQSGTQMQSSPEVYILPDDFATAGLVHYTYSFSASWINNAYTFTAPSAWGTNKPVKVRFDNNGTADGSSATIYVRDIKIESGNTATPWIAAYEDNTIDSTDSTLYGRNLLQNTSSFTNTAHWTTGSSSVVALTTNAANNLSIKKIAATDAIHTSTPTTIALVNGQKYTLTVVGRINGWDGTSAKWAGFSFADASGGAFYGQFPNFSLPTDGTFGTYRATGTASQDGLQSIALTTTGVQLNLELEIQSIKLEALPYGTDYSPAPEDNVASYPTNAAGANKWTFRYYTDGNNGTNKIYGYSDFPSLTPVYQTILPDQTNVQQSVGDYYVGYYKTAVYVSTAKTVNFQTNVDDTLNVYVNGLQQYSHLGSSAGVAVTIPLSLQAGWNTVELINQEVVGNDGIWNTNTLSSLVDEMNCNYALDYGSLKGNYGLTGYNISSMIVNTNAVTDTDLFMCLVTYRGSTYKDSVTIDDVTDAITIIVNGSRYFKNGQGTNTYTATLWQNGAQIDSSGTEYTYTWYLYNSDGSKDTSFGGSGSKTGQTITVASSDITGKGRVQCVVSK